MNSAAVNNPDLVKEAAGSRFVLCDFHTLFTPGKSPRSRIPRFELVVSRRNKTGGKDAIAWARMPESWGCVALPTSMDGDETLAGYAIRIYQSSIDAVTVPVVASGGAGTLEHFYEGVIKGGAQVLLAASSFILGHSA